MRLPRRFLYLTEKHLSKNSNPKYSPKEYIPTVKTENIMPGILKQFHYFNGVQEQVITVNSKNTADGLMPILPVPAL